MTETFRMIPAVGVSAWFGGLFVFVGVMVFTALFFLGYSFYSSGHTTFTVGSEGLRISGDAFGRFIPKEKMNLSQARVVQLNCEPSLAPRRRTMGTAMPGYAAGWFKLCNGEKSLVFVTDRNRVVYIPTLSGYSVMMSVIEPDRFVETLKRVCA